jgi:quercetin dioxygenase-like cupin family protein
MRERTLKSVLATSLGLVAAFGMLGTVVSTAAAEDPAHASMGMDRQVVLQTTVTATDQAIELPSGGKAEITSMVLTIQPGGHTNLHTHPVPILVYVLEGVLETHVGEVVRSYKAGEAVVEPQNTPMQAFNPGSEITKLLAVVVGQEGEPMSVAVE